jgi:hypothetical protein
MEKEKPVFVQYLGVNHPVLADDDVIPVLLGKTQYLCGEEKRCRYEHKHEIGHIFFHPGLLDLSLFMQS